MIVGANHKRGAKQKRAEKRINRAVPILYSNTFMENGDDPPIYEGTTYDVSPSGMSFRTHTPVEHMMTITITCERLWTEPRMGMVRWCSQIFPGVYKVGVALF